jgi:hypothetical protein
MWCRWVLWCNTTQPRKAAKLLNWAATTIGGPACGCSYQYDIDIPGISASFATKSKKSSRNECIIEAIRLCERLGSAWMISGTMRRYFALSSHKIERPGIVYCSCDPLQRRGVPADAIPVKESSLPVVHSDPCGWKGERQFDGHILTLDSGETTRVPW